MQKPTSTVDTTSLRGLLDRGRATPQTTTIARRGVRADGRRGAVAPAAPASAQAKPLPGARG